MVESRKPGKSPFSDARVKLFQRAAYDLRSLQTDETWEKWLSIGDALSLARNDIMRFLDINKPAGANYNSLMGDFLSDYGFDKIDKAARSRLQRCIDHRTQIEEWRNTLSLSERMLYNHPSTVWRHFKASSNPKPKEIRNRSQQIIQEYRRQTHD